MPPRAVLLNSSKVAPARVRIVPDEYSLEGNAVLSIGSGVTVWSATFMETFVANVRRVGIGRQR